MQRVRDALARTFGSPGDGAVDGVVARADGWSNVYTGVGTSRDKLTYQNFQASGGLAHDVLRALYSESDLVQSICSLPAKEMTREWIEIEMEDPGVAQAVSDRLDELDVRTVLTEALSYSRAFGGSVVVLGLDDRTVGDVRMRPFSTPLREDRLRDVLWLQAYAGRADIDIVGVERNMATRGFGRASAYRTKTWSTGQYDASVPYGEIIDDTRTMRFRGMPSDRSVIRSRQGWDMSVIELVYETVRDFDAGFAATARVLADFSQAVFKIKGLHEKLLSEDYATVLTRLQLLDMFRSTSRAIPLDADGSEDFRRDTTTMTGAADVLDRLMLRLSAATNIPVSILMGRAPAGLNATGEADLRAWYAFIRSEQERVLRPVLERLVLLILSSMYGPTHGVVPETWTIKFRPLWQLTEQEEADLYEKRVRTASDEVALGTLTVQEARAELHPDKEELPEKKAATGLSFLDLRLALPTAAQAGDLALYNAIRKGVASALGQELTPLAALPTAAPAGDPTLGLMEADGDARWDAGVEEAARSAVARLEEIAMSDRIVAAVGAIIPQEGASAMRALGLRGEFDVNTPQLDAYLAGVRERANLFDGTTREVVERAARMAVDKQDAEVLLSAVQTRLAAAQRIARDEAHKAINFVRTEALRQGGVTRTWNSILDGKTRPAHRRLHGQTVRADEEFVVDDWRAFAPGGFGDPSMDANCRCYVTAEGRTDSTSSARRDATEAEKRVEAVASQLAGLADEAMREQLAPVLEKFTVPTE